MDGTYVAAVMAFLVFLASTISVEMGLSVAIVEIVMGIFAGNFLGVESTPWMMYLAGFGGVLLMFLAGIEVDVDLLRDRLKESLLIGGVSFLAPFLGGIIYTHYVSGWHVQAALVAGTAISSTFLAVIYTLLVETGLNDTDVGKTIMASCFITCLGTAAALSILFADFNVYTLAFILVSLAAVFIAPRLSSRIFRRYEDHLVQPEIKFVFMLLFTFMYFADVGSGHAILPAFILGLLMSKQFNSNQALQKHLRVVSFAMITPFFFINSGLNVSIEVLQANIGLVIALFVVKELTKTIGVYPLARRYVSRNAEYTTLLMSTGLTMGTIASVFGFTSGLVTQTQFSVIISSIVLSAIVPTLTAQQWFKPTHLENKHKATGVTE